MYGAPFVTSQILLTEYNSVGQNTILLDRIQFCWTEYKFCWTELYSVQQNCILLTELYSVQQNCILSNRIQFCRQNTILS